MISQSLLSKIDARLAQQNSVEEAMDLLESSFNLNRFSSATEFKEYLTEGALLNISTIGSKALSVPCGEYLVWTTDVGTTMLVPTSMRSRNKEVYEHSDDSYEVITSKLLNNWNKLEKTLLENEGDNQPPKHEIDTDSVDRDALASAIKDNGYTVSSLATAVGVQPPAISRILRKPKQTSGDPRGRNPSIGLASQICSELRLEPTNAFPDIFNPQSKHKARKPPKNSGSGAHTFGRNNNITPGRK